jgi:thiamine-phosphate pyrophosphorylase
MRFNFTPAADRALLAAAGWTCCNDSDELDVPEVLLGLLAEPECRAALQLARFGIDGEAVRRRFANLTPAGRTGAGRASRFSANWLACLQTAERLLLEYPHPLCLATEHLLLGIVASDNEVSAWLKECGLATDSLEAEVHRLSGHQPGPLPFDADSSEESDLLLLPLGEGRGEGDRFEILRRLPLPHERLAALRAIDAAANRAGEALRVIEDYLRFVLDDRHLTSHCKQIRHDLTAALEVFPTAERNAARETQADVGTDVTLAAEQIRDSTLAVLHANFNRLEQSLRSLEEFSKILTPDTAAVVEQLRYRVYTLQRAGDITSTSLERLAHARLYVLVDGGSLIEQFQTLMEQLISSGVAVIQLRDQRLADRELLIRARLLRELTRANQTLLILNDRPDLAVLADADGVHLGQQDLTVKDARRILGPRGLIGVSTHSMEQARSAVLDGANYIGVGPTFASGTKQFSQFTGTELLRSVQAEIRLPAFAIGGITIQNLSQVLATGFTRVAVSGAIVGSENPACAAGKFLTALDA